MAVACLTAAEALLQSGETTRAEPYARRAVEAAEAIDDAEILVHSLVPLSEARARQGDTPTPSRLRSGPSYAERAGDLFAQIHALTGLEFILRSRARTPSSWTSAS